MSAASSPRPNVVLVVMDDLTWGDLACHGNPWTRTPHLDLLHAQSTRLTRYCSGPVCTPARASLMTGRYPYRTRAIDTYCGRSMMDPDEVTLARMLGQAGYRTGIFGKWHLGDNYPMRAMDQGFEEALVHNGGGLRQPSNFGRAGYFDPDLLHNGKLVASQGYCTDIFFDHALQWIDKQGRDPFFAYIATNAPHTPLEVAPSWVQPYLDMGVNPTHARLYGMVENIDWNMGKLFAGLSRWGLDENTIVIYTSDHGWCGSTRHEGQSRFNAHLRGSKGMVYDGGVRTPCFWRWPGHIRAGRNLDRVANPIDVLPTLAALCAAQVPADRVIDGVDLAPLLLDQQTIATWPERCTFLQWHRGDQPVRYRNYAAIGQRYKLLRPHEDQADQLYDLQADPGEQHDLAAAQPELVAQLRAGYDAWFDDVSSTRGPGNYDPPAIHLGTPHQNPTVLTRQDWRLDGRPDGWSDQHLGHWLVLVTQAGPFHIRVTFPPPAQPARLHLQVGAAKQECQIPPGQLQCLFEAITLPLGPQRLEAFVEEGAERRGVSYVYVSTL